MWHRARVPEVGRGDDGKSLQAKRKISTNNKLELELFHQISQKSFDIIVIREKPTFILNIMEFTHARNCRQKRSTSHFFGFRFFGYFFYLKMI